MKVKKKLTVLAWIQTANERWTNIARTCDSEGISCAGTISSVIDKARSSSSSQNWTGKGMCSQIVSDTADICTAWTDLVGTRGSQSSYTSLDNVTVVGGRRVATSKSTFKNTSHSWSWFQYVMKKYLLIQHTPNPDAQDPSLVPPMFEHSSLKIK